MRLAPLILLALAGCASPPPGALVSSAEPTSVSSDHPAGTDTLGEACHSSAASDTAGPDFAQALDVYCGVTWQQPMGRVFESKVAVPAAGLADAATSSPWRVGLDQRFSCGSPRQTTALDGAPAALLECKRRNGGFPQVALVIAAGGKSFFVDGAPSALPALETTVAEAAGLPVASTGAKSSAAELIAAATAGKPFGSGDLQQYYTFMSLGNAANDAADYASAEQAFRNALAVQQRILGADDPGLALPLMHLALQVSDQSRFEESSQLFRRAQSLTRRVSDPLIQAKLDLYLAEDQANQGHLDVAAKGADQAEREFTLYVPATLVQAARSQSGVRLASALVGDSIMLGPDGQNAVAGLAATWWFQSYLAYRASDYATVRQQTADVRALLASTGLNPPGVIPRTVRLEALGTAAAGDYSAAAQEFATSVALFQKYQGKERPAVDTLFLQGRTAAQHGDKAAALELYRQGAKLARDWGVAPHERPIGFYLAALADRAQEVPSEASALAVEIFEAMQLAQSDTTSTVLAKAFARLSAGDPKTQDLLRTIQDSDVEFARLIRLRDTATGGAVVDKDALAKLDKQIDDLQAKRKDAEEAAQAASPEYSQLVSTQAPVDTVQKLLGPDEAMLAFHIGDGGSYAALVARDHVLAWSIPLTATEVSARVAILRKAIEPIVVDGKTDLPVYDVAAAHQLYAALLGPGAADLDKLQKLVVVPSGALTTLPMEMLVTGDTAAVTDRNYGDVPFLVRKLAINYIPSPQNFVVLRKNAKPSAAQQPYIGFGDFRPASPQQLAQTFPPDRCGADLDALTHLPTLPGTRREVATIGGLFDAPAADGVLGAGFLKTRLAGADLSQFRIVHLATHALLPTDLGCLAEPLIVVSTPPDAKGADDGFLHVADLLSMKLDADLVVLSACNTGRNGKDSGDSLSGLARTFFFAGARGLLVTHWELDDNAGPLVAALTLSSKGDTATSLRDAQLTMIKEVTRKMGSPLYTHPFFWAPFVLVGDGVRAPIPAT